MRNADYMSGIQHSKLAIIGAGSVGTAVAYAALIRQSAREIVLYDVHTAKVEAEILDLAHGTQFTGATRISGGDEINVVHDAHVVVITAGARQRPGQSRLDLAATNVEILRDLMPKLLDNAPQAVFVLVTNPCDVLAVAAQRFGDLPPSRVFSSGTVLDTSRLRWLLAERAGVSMSSVHATIVGEHGDSEFPLWSEARIGPVPIADWSPPGRGRFTRSELDQIADDVRNAAYRVISGKGATNFAIGLSGARIVEAILRDEHAVLPVSSLLSDYRGVSGVALSVPCVVDARGISRVIDVPFADSEQSLFEKSADTVRRALASLGLS